MLIDDQPSWDGRYTVEVESDPTGIGRIVFIAPGAKVGLEYTNPNVVWAMALNLAAMVEQAGIAYVEGRGTTVRPEDDR